MAKSGFYCGLAKQGDTQIPVLAGYTALLFVLSSARQTLSNAQTTTVNVTQRQRRRRHR
jgi:hypothetical protein